jgi:hypothetical protein
MQHQKYSKSPTGNIHPKIASPYPDLSSAERADAEYRLLGYLGVVKRIFERVCRENPEILTELEQRATLRKQTPHVKFDQGLHH